MEFRKALAEDRGAIELVIFSVLTEFGLKPEPDGIDRDLADIERHYFSPGGYFEVCEVGGKIVGTWGIRPETETRCDLKKMYLLPEFRGQGIGRAMLERAIKKAKNLGFNRMELDTASVLKGAIALYLQYGFVQIWTKALATRCDQAYGLDLR
jgi:putative acetyltransferase